MRMYAANDLDGRLTDGNEIKFKQELTNSKAYWKFSIYPDGYFKVSPKLDESYSMYSKGDSKNYGKVGVIRNLESKPDKDKGHFMLFPRGSHLSECFQFRPKSAPHANVYAPFPTENQTPAKMWNDVGIENPANLGKSHFRFEKLND